VTPPTSDVAGDGLTEHGVVAAWLGVARLDYGLGEDRSSVPHYFNLPRQAPARLARARQVPAAARSGTSERGMAGRGMPSNR
jgi:hypothetical protein